MVFEKPDCAIIDEEEFFSWYNQTIVKNSAALRSKNSNRIQCFLINQQERFLPSSKPNHFEFKSQFLIQILNALETSGHRSVEINTRIWNFVDKL